MIFILKLCQSKFWMIDVYLKLTDFETGLSFRILNTRNNAKLHSRIANSKAYVLTFFFGKKICYKINFFCIFFIFLSRESKFSANERLLLLNDDWSASATLPPSIGWRGDKVGGVNGFAA